MESDPDSEAFAYLTGRAIPRHNFSTLRWGSVKELMALIPRYADRIPQHDRIAIFIPFIQDDTVFYIQARSIDPADKMRYQTLEVQEGGVKVWGASRALKHPDRPVYVFEGAFDAMFCPGACACAGADMNEVKQWLIDKGHCGEIRLVWDADWKSNREIMARVKKAVNNGASVVLLDEQLPGKDLNEAVINGFKIEDIPSYLESRTFSGLSAELELSRVCPMNNKQIGNGKKQKNKKRSTLWKTGGL